METKIFQCNKEFHQENIKEAANLLCKGEAVAFPTETVYGIGANAFESAAVAKIFAAKGRPSDNPLNVLVPSKRVAFSLAENIPNYVEPLMDVFSPGPITYILPSAGKVASNVSAHLGTVGVRIPDHQIALQLLKETALPLAAPSANLSGKPSPTTATHVIDDLMGRVAAIIDGGPTNVGLESTVVDCTGAIPIILRTGMIAQEDIQQVVGACHLAPALKMPSNKYKHYLPEVPLIVVEDKEQLSHAIQEEISTGKRVGVIKASGGHIPQVDKVYLLGTNEEGMAIKLYDTLRSLKSSEIDVVISEPFTSSIIMDRLKSAATKVI